MQRCILRRLRAKAAGEMGKGAQTKRTGTAGCGTCCQWQKVCRLRCTAKKQAIYLLCGLCDQAKAGIAKKELREKKGIGGSVMKYILFCIRWLWKNRTWTGTRQKYKAMDRDWNRKQTGRMTYYI